MPDTAEYIGPLDELTKLADEWRESAARIDPVTERHRLAGIKSALTHCADQLAETVERMLADA